MEFVVHVLVRSLIFSLFFTGSAFVIIWFYFRIRGKNSVQVHHEEKNLIIPIRLQAYERTVLFLERITPGNLVMRIHRPEMNAQQLQTALIKAIREEYEYNHSQQLYLSLSAWELVKHAKEETIRLINVASGKVPETASSAELVRTIMEMVVAADKLPVSRAIEEIKKEIQKEF